MLYLLLIVFKQFFNWHLIFLKWQLQTWSAMLLFYFKKFNKQKNVYYLVKNEVPTSLL